MFGSDVQDGSDRLQAHYWHECIFVINAWYLAEALCYSSNLSSYDVAMLIPFMDEVQFGFDNVLV